MLTKSEQDFTTIYTIFTAKVPDGMSSTAPALFNPDLPTFRKSPFLTGFLMFLFLVVFSQDGFGQNGVTITSTASNPTPDSPIPITIKFEDAVDLILPTDFTVSNGSLNNFKRLVPDFKFLAEKKIDKFSVTANAFDFLFSGMSFSEYFSSKIKDAVVSIDFNNKGELIFLTFGNGVFKYDTSGNHIQLIKGYQFTSPLDMVLSSNNQILIADKDSYRVRVFKENPRGAYTFNYDIGGSKGKDGDEFYGPTGLAINSSDELFVADAYTGSELNVLDQVKIYKIDNNNATFYRRFDSFGNIKIDDPYRIAVDKNNFVYLSDSGGNSGLGRVLIFNNNDKLIGVIEGGEQGAPGSIIVDTYGYIYIVNYKKDLTFNGIFQDPVKLINNFDKIKNTSYEVNVFDSQFNYITKINENINLPIDLTLDKCEHIFVNNLKLAGKAAITGIDATFDFKLEEYKRQDKFTAEVVPESPGLVTVFIKDIELFKCDPQPNDRFSIEYKPANNTAPIAKCKSATIYLDASGNAILNATQVYDGDAETDNVSLSLNKTNFTCVDFGENQVTLTVTNKDNASLSDTCIATIIVLDQMSPVAKCIAPGKEFILNNASVTISATDIDDGSSDNCEIANREVSPKTFTSAGTKTITLIVTDSSGKKDECTTTIEVIDNTPPPAAKCKSATIYLDASGNAILNATQVYDGDAETDNVSLSLSKNKFTCADLGSSNEVTLTVTNKDNASLSDTCDAVITIVDLIPPVADCIGTFTVQLDANGNASISVDDIDNSSTDNCEITSKILSQYNFTRADIGENTITLTITDSSYLTDKCNVLIIVEDNNVPEANCKSTTLSLDTEGLATLTAAQVYEGDVNEDGVTVKINKTDFDCSNLGENLVTLTVTTENGKSDNCISKVTVVDQIPPVVACPQDILVPYTTTKSFTTGDYSSQLDISDNCSTSFEISQQPEPGTLISADTLVEFTVTDANNNVSTCNFNIKFYKATNIQILNCPADEIFELDENCSYLTPDIAATITTNIEDAVVTQSIEPGFRINGSITLTITAKFEDQTDTCEVKLIGKDTTNPTINCPGDQNETIVAGEGFELPNYILMAQADDNCYPAEFDQQPEIGDVIYESTEVTLFVKDEAGNTARCSFMINISKETPDLTIDCPADITENLNENCQFILPDYRELAATNTDAIITQNPAAGTIMDSNTSVTLTAKTNSSSADCTFNVILIDVTPPTAKCVSAITIFLNENNQASIMVNDIDNGSSDSCGNIQMSLDQSNFTQYDLGENWVTLTITDASGNIDTCNTIVTVKPFDLIPDFECISQIQVFLDENGVAKIIPSDLITGNPGNTSFSLDKDTFTCDDLPESTVNLNYAGTVSGQCSVDILVIDSIAPKANCVSTYDLYLDTNGDASLTAAQINNNSTDNCGTTRMELSQSNFNEGDLGENSVIFTVYDFSGNSATCEVLVNVRQANTSGDINCQENYTVQLDKDGNASLDPVDLLIGDLSGYTINASKTIFTCAELGEQIITISYNNGSDSGSCLVTVFVKDKIPPTVLTNNITIGLNANNQAILTADLVNAGSTDNCEIISYSLDKLIFSCKDIGENTVILTTTDSSGNSASQPAIITITGECDEVEIPDNGIDHIFIYPNPTSGNFQIAVPSSQKLMEVEVYDMRGRFIMTRKFADDDFDYRMDLTGVQQGVYTLNMITSTGAVVRRVIIF